MCVERRRTREPVERGALHRRIEQRLVRVLPVQVDERAPDLGELARRGQPAVDVSAAATVARQHAREHRLRPRLGMYEASLDARFGGAVAYERDVGPPADEQLERFHQEGLARAGLAGDRGETGCRTPG